ncbi:hypothetical protein KC960_01160 [Candidatus Saccharibacteria bacterium]|nr:hypothetical protein [Candidatus Saccharibacteria bacterium]
MAEHFEQEQQGPVYRERLGLPSAQAIVAMCLSDETIVPELSHKEFTYLVEAMSDDQKARLNEALKLLGLEAGTAENVTRRRVCSTMAFVAQLEVFSVTRTVADEIEAYLAAQLEPAQQKLFEDSFLFPLAAGE